MMKVGDIGILQNLVRLKHLNGLPSEIISLLEKGKKLNDTLNTPEEDGYRVLCCEGSDIMIDHSKIRPITDPDQEEDTEDQLGLTQ